MFESKLRKHPQSIVLPEGSDPRILEAASRLLAANFLFPILIGKEEEIFAAAEEAGFNIRGAKIIDPQNYERFDEMVELFVKLREHRDMTAEKAKVKLLHPNYFGCMLVRMGEADSILSGATYNAMDTLLPLMQILKDKGREQLVSSCYVLDRANATGENTRMIMGDCAINIDPSEDELVTMCGDMLKCARSFDMVQKLAFLFPDVQSVNIGYKIAARMCNFSVYGPIMLGLDFKGNGLSRSCNPQEVYTMAVITAAGVEG